MISASSRYVKCALRAARRNGLTARFKTIYRTNRHGGRGPAMAAYIALYELGLLYIVYSELELVLQDLIDQAE
jgi:hypothetical protein